MRAFVLLFAQRLRSTRSRNQDRLLFQVGARKWWAKPLFSQQTFNSEKQKFDRFFQQDRFTCATFFGLTTYQPAPVVVYKQMEDGSVRAYPIHLCPEVLF
jgi:hypothetical protein